MLLVASGSGLVVHPVRHAIEASDASAEEAAVVGAIWRSLIGVEWGFGFRGVNTNGSRGTNVIRVSGYKVF